MVIRICTFPCHILLHSRMSRHLLFQALNMWHLRRHQMYSMTLTQVVVTPPPWYHPPPCPNIHYHPDILQILLLKINVQIRHHLSLYQLMFLKLLQRLLMSCANALRVHPQHPQPMVMIMVRLPTSHRRSLHHVVTHLWSASLLLRPLWPQTRAIRRRHRRSRRSSLWDKDRSLPLL